MCRLTIASRWGWPSSGRIQTAQAIICCGMLPGWHSRWGAEASCFYYTCLLCSSISPDHEVDGGGTSKEEDHAVQTEAQRALHRGCSSGGREAGSGRQQQVQGKAAAV